MQALATCCEKVNFVCNLLFNTCRCLFFWGSQNIVTMPLRLYSRRRVEHCYPFVFHRSNSQSVFYSCFVSRENTCTDRFNTCRCLFWGSLNIATMLLCESSVIEIEALSRALLSLCFPPNSQRVFYSWFGFSSERR